MTATVSTYGQVGANDVDDDPLTITLSLAALSAEELSDEELNVLFEAVLLEVNYFESLSSSTKS